jgi:hypothetical protein
MTPTTLGASLLEAELLGSPCTATYLYVGLIEENR